MSKVIIPKPVFVFLIYPLVLLTGLLSLLIVFSTPVSAATEFTCMVDPDNGSGTDYTSLSDWEAAINTDLVSSSTKVYSVSTASSTGTTTDGAIVTGSVSTTTKATVKHYTNTTHQILVENIRKVLTGTLTFSTSSSDVTGSGTDFTNELQAGDHIWLESAQTWQEVASISSSTLLTLTATSTISGTGQASRKLRDGGTDSAFQANEELQVDASNYVTITNNGDSAIAVASCRSTNGSPDTTAVTIDGWTTSATNYIKVWTDPSLGNRHSGKWDDGKYRLEISSNNNSLRIANDNVRVEGLQVQVSSNGPGHYGIGSDNQINIIIADNIVRADNGGYNSYGIRVAGYSTIHQKVYNNIVYNIYGGTNSMGIDLGCCGARPYVYNNTVYNCDYGIKNEGSGNGSKMTAKNNLSINNSTADYYSWYSAGFQSFSNNISSDGTADDFGGTGNKINQTVSFVDSATDDFHLSPSDTSAKDAGTDLSADPNLAFTTDIDGAERDPDGYGWDIGADEVPAKIYRSVGPSATSTLQDDNSHADTITISSGTATFSSALADNIGVGDVVLYDSNDDDSLTSADSIAFIKSRIDSTHYTLQTQSGAMPTDLSANDTWAIYRAYTSLANAESGTVDSTLSNLGITFTGGNRDLVTNNEQWNIACYANGTTADTTSLSTYGWTTSQSNYLKFYTPTSSSETGITQRHNGKWDDSKYKMVITNGSAFYNNMGAHYFWVEGLQIKLNNNSGSSVYGIWDQNLGSDAVVWVTDNIIWGNFSGAGSSGIAIGSNDSLTYKIWNNVIYDFINNTENIYAINGGWSYAYIYNNTFVNNYYGINRWSGTTIAKNNIVQNNTTDYSGNFDVSSDYNISSDDTAPGAHSKINTNVSFVSTSTDDFHLSPSDTSAKDAGTDLSADSNLAFTTDIDGDSRPSGSAWDIGADEELSVYFDSTSSSGLESSTSVSLPIKISSSYSSDITVNYTLTGTATGSGTDYTDLGSGSVTIPAGQTTTSIPLTIVDDNLDENNETIIATLSSVSSGLLGSTTTYTYTILDNDTAGITISPTSDLTTTEAGGTDTFTIVLNSQPTSNVVINLSSSDTSEGMVSPSSITFTSSNWNTPQTITVSGVDDYLLDGNIAYTINISNSISSDSNYNGLAPNVSSLSALNVDDDVAGGGLPAAALTPPTPPAPSPENPQGGFRIIINSINNNNNNNGNKTTNNRLATLTLVAGPNTQKMAISNYSDFRESIQIPYQSKYQWQLLPGSGTKTVYAKFYTQCGQPSKVISDTIELECNGSNSSCNQTNNNQNQTQTQNQTLSSLSSLQDGDLIRNPNADGMAKYDVYIVKIIGDKKFKRLIINPKVFESYGDLFDHNKNGNPWDDIRLVNQSTMDQFKTSTLVRCSDPSVGINDPKVYQLSPNEDQGTKTWLDMTPQQFEADGYDWDEIFTINQVERELYK